MTGRPRLDAALIAAAAFLAGVVLVVVLKGVNHDRTTTVTQRVAGPTTTRTETRTQTRTVQSPPPPAELDGGVSVPDVVGRRLDEARAALSDAGLENDIVSGGGAFGPVDDSAWVVTDQDPSGGSGAQEGDTVDLAIERP